MALLGHNAREGNVGLRTFSGSTSFERGLRQSHGEEIGLCCIGDTWRTRSNLKGHRNFGKNLPAVVGESSARTLEEPQQILGRSGLLFHLKAQTSRQKIQ